MESKINKAGRPYIDIAAMRFGSLKVISKSPIAPGGVWLCLCDCGRKVEKLGYRLRSGASSTCGQGSCRKVVSTRIDLTGLRFGRLTIIGSEAVGRATNGNMLWQVRCDCGVVKTAPVGPLRAGKIRSCGCLRVLENVRQDIGDCTQWLQSIDRPARYWEFEQQGFEWVLEGDERMRLLEYVHRSGWRLRK